MTTVLILGANYETIPLVRAAQSMGVRVIVSDHRPDSPAKRVANSAWDIDGMDVLRLKDACERENVSGILVGVADRLIRPYQQLCKVLHLPCYADERTSQIFTDKQEFGRLCLEFGIPPIPNWPVSSQPTPEELRAVAYPVLTKPVDGCSGKGMSVCRNSAELRDGLTRALAASPSRRFLVERYMECDDVLIYFTFQNGRVILSAMADRYTTREQSGCSRVCIGAIYPSKYLHLFKEKLLEPYTRMFQELDIQNGVFLICGFVSDNTIYTYDPGFRLQGEAPDVHVRTVFGVDQRKLLVEFALTGVFGADDLSKVMDASFGGRHCATVWFLAKAGCLAEVSGIEEIKCDRSVTEVIQRLQSGSEVTPEMVGTEGQVVCRVYLDCDSREELCNSVERVQQLLKVRDQSGGDMLLRGINARDLP